MKPQTTSKRKIYPERIYELILKNLRNVVKNKKIKVSHSEKKIAF